MGVSLNFYTVFGAKLDWNDDFNDAYDEVYDDKDTPFVLMDAMEGEYMIFGEVLFDSGDARYGFEDGDSFKEIELSKLADMEKEYKEKFIQKFPQFRDMVDKPFKLMTLAHYS